MRAKIIFQQIQKRVKQELLCFFFNSGHVLCMFYTSLYFPVFGAFYEHAQTWLPSFFPASCWCLLWACSDMTFSFFPDAGAFYEHAQTWLSLFFPDAGAFYEHARSDMTFPLFLFAGAFLWEDFHTLLSPVFCYSL